MSQHNLRHKPRISYYEPEEPDLDEYVFCEKCGDYVYEYCSIHGPLLVIPDDKVPTKPNVPSYVPRAALTIPHVFLHITYSIIPDAGLGVFTSMALPSGVRFGPYLGQRTDAVDSSYCWQIYDKNRKPVHCIDAADANKSNWMRYVNCARHWREQNLVAYQYQGKLYYRTIKIIPRFTELMVFYGSEFACELDVDLGKYNSPAGYAQKFGAPVAKKRKPNDVDMKTKPHEEEIVTANAEATTTDTSTCASSAIKDITSETLKGQVIFTSVGPGQVETNLNKKTETAVTKAKKAKNNTATKNNANNNNDEKITHNKATKIAQTKQNTAFTLKPTIERKESRNTELKTNEDKIAESKPETNLTYVDLYIYCDSCNKKFVSQKDLEKHLRCHDLSRKYACVVCNARFTENHVLKTHMRIHTGEKPFPCSVCNAKFSENGSLKTHMRTHTGEKPYACSICKKGYYQNSNLKYHMKTHTGEKPYNCSICKKGYYQNSNLKYHRKTHTGEKPYNCSICKASFTLCSTLKIHMRIHTGEKPYACAVCNTKFSLISYLKLHKRTHTGEKPYACSVCNAKFSDNSNLKRHMRTHTGEKPYACSVCNAKFSDNSNLKTHMRTHTGEKPYACEICDTKFTIRCNLETHMRIHTGEKPYACEICDAKYSHTISLKTHLVKIHLGGINQKA